MIGSSMIDLKRQDFPPGLWIVATPIGNLADLAPRGLEALRRASVIYCEDTRRTSELLAALGVRVSVKRLDAHASPALIGQIIRGLMSDSGSAIAYVSDAGAPGISDPGSALVREARSQGIRVTPFPGASAVTLLMQAAGFEDGPWAFLGFFPRKQGDQTELLEECDRQAHIRTFVWFESPKRILETLQQLASRWPQASACVGKEMTKIHEHFFCGLITQVVDDVQEQIRSQGEKGEWCIGLQLPPVKSSSSDEAMSVSHVVLECLIEAGVPASDAARRVSQRFGIPRKTVYALALKLIQNKNESGP